MCTWYEIHLSRQLSYLLCVCPPQIVTKSLPLILRILNLRTDRTDSACVLLTIQFYTVIIVTHTFNSGASGTRLNIFPCSNEKRNYLNLKVKKQEWCVLVCVALSSPGKLHSCSRRTFRLPNFSPLSLYFLPLEHSWCWLAVITQTHILLSTFTDAGL